MIPANCTVFEARDDFQDLILDTWPEVNRIDVIVWNKRGRIGIRRRDFLVQGFANASKECCKVFGNRQRIMIFGTINIYAIDLSI